MNKFKPGFELPILTDEVACNLRTVLYVLMDIFEANYCHEIERYRRQRSLASTNILNPNKDQDQL